MRQETLGGLAVTSVAEKLTYINLLVYGESGVGKTRLIGSADEIPEMRPVIIIDLEGGTLSIRDLYPGVDVVRVDKWHQFQGIYDELAAGKHPYKTVGLDSLSEMQKFNMADIMNKVVLKDADRDPDVPSMREYMKNGEILRRLVRAFRDLPMHTLMSALPRLDKDNQTSKIKVRPALSDKLATEVPAYMDEVLYHYKKTVGSDVKRLALTSGTDKEVAKDRSGALPDVLENPTMKVIYDYIFKTKEKAA